MKNITIRYGLYYAAALCAGFIASYLVLGTDEENYSLSEVVGYSIMLVCSLVIVFAVKAAKRHSGNQINFARGLGIGLGVTVIGSLFFAIYNWVYVVWLHPEFLAEYMAYSKTQILNSGLSQTVIDEQLAELAAYSDMMSNPLMMAAIMFVTIFMIGLLFSLVAAAAFRSKRS